MIEIDKDGKRVITLCRFLSKASPTVGTPGELDTGRPLNKRWPTIERFGVGDHPRIPASPPEGALYDMVWTSDGRHPAHNPCYEIINVPGRTAILLHAANWYQQLKGCIAPGEKAEEVVDETGKWLGTAGAKQMGVSSSHAALAAILDDLRREDVRLRIVEVP